MKYRRNDKYDVLQSIAKKPKKESGGSPWDWYKSTEISIQSMKDPGFNLSDSYLTLRL